MKIALAQMNIKWEDKEYNKIKIEDMTEKAKNEKSDFIIFPEMTLTGFSFDTQKLGESKYNSDTINFFKSLSIKLDINICFGAIIKEDNFYYNKCFVVNKNGMLISDYSKIHPFSYSGEDKFFEKGKKIVFYEIDGIHMSNFICYDLRFPEIFRIDCEKREVIIVIANWPESRREHWISLLKSRAVENQCFVVGVNRTGDGNGISYCGDSAVFNPKGNMILNCKDNEDVFFCDILNDDVFDYRNKFPVLNDRNKFYMI